MVSVDPGAVVVCDRMGREWVVDRESHVDHGDDTVVVVKESHDGPNDCRMAGARDSSGD